VTPNNRTRIAGLHRAVLVCVASALAAGVAGCTASGSKAGPDRPATVLHLATTEAQGAPYTEDLERFTARVEDLTDGEVRLEVDDQLIPWTPTSERTVTEMVQDGDVDLALIPTRVFDTMGISGFEALQAPMLIDSPELAAAVASSDIAGTMLEGLDRHGLVGLGLVFEGLRRPMALNGAITGAGDFEGRLVRVPASDVSDRVFEALGAVPDHGADHLVATNGEPYALVETELEVADTDYSPGSTTTIDLVLFPKYGALLAQPDVLGDLTDEQVDAVRQAAEDTVAAAAQTIADEQELAATYCEVAGDLIEAPASGLQSIERRLRTVVDELRQDARTATAIRAIEGLKESTVAPAFRTPSACSPLTGDGARLPSAPAAPTP
jgi:TRAP-type transport system periplasmic protein